LSEFLIATVMRFFLEKCCVASVLWWLHLATNFDKILVILSQEIQLIEFLVSFPDFFHLSHLLREGGYTVMQFLPCTGDATIFKKMASPSQAKNRSCSHGFTKLLNLDIRQHFDVCLSLPPQFYQGEQQ